jgi:deazaflavin-dependent oxidoreductase (nitroreductase family)
MGMIAALGYKVRGANVVQRALQRIASSRPGAWFFSKTVHHVDRVVFSLSKGRLTVPGMMAGLPVLMVVTTGVKSGQQRVSPLLGIPIDDQIAIIGTNFGQAHTPGWVYNIEAEPRVGVRYRDREVSAIARPASDQEYDEVFARAAAVYPGYRKYRQRIVGRTVRVFVLEPAA